MAIIVTGDLYERIDGQLREIKRQMRLKGGYPFDPLVLSRVLQDVIEGRFGGLFPSKIYAADLIPAWATIVEDVELSVFDVSKLLPQSFVGEGESPIGGDEMRRRAPKLGGNLGLSDGKRMLGDNHGKDIPVAFRGYYIPLPGTVLRTLDGDLYVPYLVWAGRGWYLNFSRLDVGWFDCGRFACNGE